MAQSAVASFNLKGAALHVFSELQDAMASAKAVAAAWEGIKGSHTSYRIHHAKERAEERKRMESAVTNVQGLLKSKQSLHAVLEMHANTRIHANSGTLHSNHRLIRGLQVRSHPLSHVSLVLYRGRALLRGVCAIHTSVGLSVLNATRLAFRLAGSYAKRLTTVR